MFETYPQVTRMAFTPLAGKLAKPFEGNDLKGIARCNCLFLPDLGRVKPLSWLAAQIFSAFPCVLQSNSRKKPQREHFFFFSVE